ncbi:MULTISPECIES: RHS repeat-associated core domain-containing protein [unclassified Curtobacterium]|uniref:RHS repeat-associated core domain-containing protein n=1 Tax=unclassified Curtobacterium TaxID=257496 RepID=UPI0015E8E060|nr:MULTISPECIES: RHS repeat-associated core domain-containing protein [unclassified Curtobacterium]
MRLIETCLGGAAEGPIAQLQLGAKHASLASFTPRLRTWWTGSGTPVGVLSDDGQRAYTVSFDPYGNRTVVSGGTSPWFEYLPFGYKTGIRITGDGLVKFGQRWYLPVAGGWTQEDTLDAPLDPSNANRYAFAGDDPINNSDPSGKSILGAVVSGAVDALSVAGTAVGCALLAGVGCLVAGIVAGAVFGGLGGIAGGAIDGDSGSALTEDGLEGAAAGAAGGLVGGLVGKGIGSILSARE